MVFRPVNACYFHRELTAKQAKYDYEDLDKNSECLFKLLFFAYATKILS